jgi:RNA polymerase-binding protein DksA
MYPEKKKELESLEVELGQRLENLNKDLSKSHSSDSGEQAVERENDEVVEKLRDETATELVQIKQALARIENDEYGICQSCGEQINPKRLDIMPYTTLCIKCAEAES